MGKAAALLYSGKSQRNKSAMFFSFPVISKLSSAKILRDTLSTASQLELRRGKIKRVLDVYEVCVSLTDNRGEEE